MVLRSLSHVSLFKHQFVPLLNLFAPYLVVCSGSDKSSIVPPVPLRERARARSSVFCLLFLIFFQLSGQDLRGNADTKQGPNCHHKEKQAVSSYLLGLLIPVLH